MNGLHRPSKRRVIASCTALALAVVVGSVLVVTSASAGSGGNSPQGISPTAPGTSMQVTSATQNIDIAVTFNSAAEQHQITVNTNGQAGTVSASSEDCCIPNDRWQSTILDVTGGTPPLGVVPTSKTNPFNGVARVHVTYAVGTDVFPAGMTERISAPVGSTVTFDY